jgi:hypothetical protein
MSAIFSRNSCGVHAAWLGFGGGGGRGSPERKKIFYRALMFFVWNNELTRQRLVQESVLSRILRGKDENNEFYY